MSSYRSYYEPLLNYRGRKLSEKPTVVTARYINTYKSSNIPIARAKSPIDTNRLTNKIEDKIKLDRKIENSYSNRLTTETNSALSSKYTIPSKSSSCARNDTGIPIKADKKVNTYSTGYFKLYQRPTTFSKTNLKTDTNFNKISNNITQNNNKNEILNKNDNIVVNNDININVEQSCTDEASTPAPTVDNEIHSTEADDTETLTVVTRSTSPTPPGSSSFVRARRADMAKVIEKTITRQRKRESGTEKEVQTDRIEEASRWYTRPPSARISYRPVSTNYSGYAGRFSTQYHNLRETTPTRLFVEKYSSTEVSNSSRSSSSKSPSKERTPPKQIVPMDNKAPEIVTVYHDRTEGETSEIIINVNLTLKKKKPTFDANDNVSPEITISNSLLPPQAPKENGKKIKKIKSRRSSSESVSSEGKKKCVKKRSKSKESDESDTSSSKTNTEPNSNNSFSCSRTCSTSSVEPDKVHTNRQSKSLEDTSSLPISNNLNSSSEDEYPERRTENNMTSADVSLSLEDNISENMKNESSKAFLIRALATVTDPYGERSQYTDYSAASTNKDVTNLLTESEKNLRSTTEKSSWGNTSHNSKNKSVHSDVSEPPPGRKIRPIESGERAWWLDNSEQKSENNSNSNKFDFFKVRHIDSGEKDWWISSQEQQTSKSDTDKSDTDEQLKIPPFPSLSNGEPLGDRRSPEGIEAPPPAIEKNGRKSPYEDLDGNSLSNKKFISRYADIDDILGTSGQIFSPFRNTILDHNSGLDDENVECEEIDPTQVRIHDSTAQLPVIKKMQCSSDMIDCGHYQLDDAALQIFKDGDYGSYLDLDATISEQEEEIEGVLDSKKNSIVMRTQLSVRVHTIIEKLLHSQGRELRHALFSLKQILQSDKDLVHEFILNHGLDCLIQLGTMADQNYLDYILRALGQILLYIDGMHGVMKHEQCIQWLYSLIASKFRHVVKTSLKLLLVFVEYAEENCSLLINAIEVEDKCNNRPPWHNIMRILKDIDASDTELLIYTMTLINRCLISTKDRNKYYDQVDALEEQDIADIVNLYMSKQGTDLDLLRQFQIYEAVLSYEDGVDVGSALKQLDDSIVKCLRQKMESSEDRRRSKRCRSIEYIVTNNESQNVTVVDALTVKQEKLKTKDKIFKSRIPVLNVEIGIRKKRARFVRQRRLMSQQQFYNKESICSTIPNINIVSDENGNQMYTTGLKNRIQNGSLGHTINVKDALVVMRQKQMENNERKETCDRFYVPRENSIKDIANKLTSSNNLVNGNVDEKHNRVGDMSGLILKAKEGLAKSQSKEVIKSPTLEIIPKLIEVKAENELHWEELKSSLNRKLQLCDLDFTDLDQDDDDDLLKATSVVNGPPPPPPPPPMFINSILPPPPPPMPSMNFEMPIPPPISDMVSISSDVSSQSNTIRKNKKTVKLFWKEIGEYSMPEPLLKKVGGLIWDDLPDVSVDTSALENLFESRTNDLLIKKLLEPKHTLILDTKRSNAINIGMKKLPTPRTIKTAILKMDASVIGREGIEKLLTMLPTPEERTKIHEAQYANPDLPLGSAEQFLLALASISELPSRLKLWLFKLDFDNAEKEIAEPLMDLKQGIELLKVNKTFKTILSTLRSVGSFLNGNNVKGFRLEYLSKVMEVKDTVHKHPLLYHICKMIMEKFPDTSDFFSEVGPVIRASKADFEQIKENLKRLEIDCKASWDHLKKIAKHDGPMITKTRMNEFLTDAAERIILLGIIRKRVMNRYEKFLLHIGVPLHEIPKTRPSDFLKIVAEFALEYRTSRERVVQQLQKRASHRERNKTRGKMIVNVTNFNSSKNGDVSADKALEELLMSNGDRKSKTKSQKIDVVLSPEHEIMESFKTVSQTRNVKKDRRKVDRISKNYSRNLFNVNRSLLHEDS